MEVRARRGRSGAGGSAVAGSRSGALPTGDLPGVRLPVHRGRRGVGPLPQLRSPGGGPRRGVGVSRRDWEEAYRRSPKRRERFVTLSFEEVPPLGLPAAGEVPEAIGYPGEYPYTRGVHPPVPGKAVDHAPVRRHGHGRADQRALPPPAREGPAPGSRWPSTTRRSWASTPTTLWRGRGGQTGVAVDTLDDMERLFDGIPLGEISMSMTINAPAPGDLRHVPGERRAAGSGLRTAARHAAERHPQGVHRPEGVDLPARAASAADHRPDGLLRRPRAAVEHHLGVSGYHIREAGRRPPRSWPSPWPTASPTSSTPWRRGHGRSTTSPRACRSSSTPTSTSSRRSPSCAPRGASGRGTCGRRYQREGPALLALPLPRPDGRLQPHRPAARDQRGAHRHRGPRRRARRLPEPAHQLARRGARAALGEGGRDRAAHPADHRLRERRGRT